MKTVVKPITKAEIKLFNLESFKVFFYSLQVDLLMVTDRTTRANCSWRMEKCLQAKLSRCLPGWQAGAGMRFRARCCYQANTHSKVSRGKKSRWPTFYYFQCHLTWKKNLKSCSKLPKALPFEFFFQSLRTFSKLYTSKEMYRLTFWSRWCDVILLNGA